MLITYRWDHFLIWPATSGRFLESHPRELERPYFFSQFLFWPLLFAFWFLLFIVQAFCEQLLLVTLSLTSLVFPTRAWSFSKRRWWPVLDFPFWCSKSSFTPFSHSGFCQSICERCRRIHGLPCYRQNGKLHHSSLRRHYQSTEIPSNNFSFSPHFAQVTGSCWSCFLLRCLISLTISF